MLAGAPISWHVGKQDRIALSTCEAETRTIHSMKDSIKQVMWYNKVCHELSIKRLAPSGEEQIPLLIHEDNLACIAYSRNPVRHSTMKHLERDIYWIQEAVQRKEVELVATPTKLQWADIGTKPLQYPVFSFIRSNIMHP